VNSNLNRQVGGREGGKMEAGFCRRKTSQRGIEAVMNISDGDTGIPPGRRTLSDSICSSPTRGSILTPNTTYDDCCCLFCVAHYSQHLKLHGPQRAGQHTCLAAWHAVCRSGSFCASGVAGCWAFQGAARPSEFGCACLGFGSVSVYTLSEM
jgi:hypothetical protein